MIKPKLTERQLSNLLVCLCENFIAANGANTSKLADHQFSILDRMSCAKASGLNFMYQATAHDGQRFQGHNSIYVDAINTLVQRGLVQWCKDQSLAFSLTLDGYEKAYLLINVIQPSRFERLKRLLNENPGVLAVFIPLVTAFAAWVYATIRGNN